MRQVFPLEHIPLIAYYLRSFGKEILICDAVARGRGFANIVFT